MKRFIIILSLFLSSSFFLGAQVNVSSGNPLVGVNVKRAIAEGPDVFVDMIITCHTNWERIIFSTSNMNPSCRLFDDEGNLYQSGKNDVMVFEIDGKRNYWFPELVVERDVPRKVRVIVKNVDEYAAMFTKVILHYSANNVDFVENEYIITIKDLPITR